MSGKSGDERLLHELKNSISAARVAVTVALEAAETDQVASLRRTLHVARSALIAAADSADRLDRMPSVTPRQVAGEPESAE